MVTWITINIIASLTFSICYFNNIFSILYIRCTTIIIRAFIHCKAYITSYYFFSIIIFFIKCNLNRFISISKRSMWLINVNRLKWHFIITIWHFSFFYTISTFFCNYFWLFITNNCVCCTITIWWFCFFIIRAFF